MFSRSSAAPATGHQGASVARSRSQRLRSLLVVLTNLRGSQSWRWRFVLVHWIMSVMPYQRANMVRAMLYRWAELALGPSSIVYGKLRLWGGPDPIAYLRIGRLCRINTPCSINLDATDRHRRGGWRGQRGHALCSSAYVGRRQSRTRRAHAQPISCFGSDRRRLRYAAFTAPI